MNNRGIPAHLPKRLTITLWDFGWYTMTMPGEPFEDLDRAFAEAVERGYNTVRICAMPMLLFSKQGLRGERLEISNLGHNLGHRTRWFNNKGGASLDGLEHLRKLFQAARRHDCFVILSSWEYQQSPAFLRTDEIYRELMSIAPKERFVALADAMAQLVHYLKSEELADRIAYAELHNEVEFGKLTDVLPALSETDAVQRIGEPMYAGLKPYLEEAVTAFRFTHPDILFTVGYSLARPKIGYWKHVAENVQVGHFHLYNDGVLRALYDAVFQEPFPNALAKSMIRSEAPLFESYRLKDEGGWRFEVFPVQASNFYMFDWCDPVKWDLWLYEHYALYRESMRVSIAGKIDMFADWAEARHVPVVLGEGYVGYTPKDTNFEEGPVGKDIAEYCIDRALEKNFWGMVLSSVCAPHHHFWSDLEWQQQQNAKILNS